MLTASPLWGLLSILLLVGLCVLSVPLAASMGVVGFIFAVLFTGFLQGTNLAGINAWFHSKDYTMMMIPLFILMGEIVGQSGLGAMAYDCFYKWLINVKGGLAIVTTLTCAAFSTITGSSAATIATVGGIGLPEMTRRGYSVGLRTGCVAISGILANLIPPSLMGIFYCVLTEVSVGKVFIAGMIPGVILALFIGLTSFTWVWLRPKAAPVSKEAFTWRERIVALKGPVPLLLMFLLIVGGIYTGVFSPTEAAGAGVVLALAVVALYKLLTWRRVKNALASTVKTTAFIMFIVLGAMLFAKMIAMSQLATWVADAVVRMSLPPIGMMFMVALVFIVAGCFLDVFGLMVLFVPLFYPTVVAVGYDPIWFGTFSVVLVEIGLITPPVAGNIFVTQVTDPKATTVDVIKGVMPFYAGAIVLVALLIIFPQLALWLPNRM